MARPHSLHTSGLFKTPVFSAFTETNRKKEDVRRPEKASGDRDPDAGDEDPWPVHHHQRPSRAGLRREGPEAPPESWRHPRAPPPRVPPVVRRSSVVDDHGGAGRHHLLVRIRAAPLLQMDPFRLLRVRSLSLSPSLFHRVSFRSDYQNTLWNFWFCSSSCYRTSR